MNHSNYCHCGKWAKFHVSGDEGCGNVCGIHARKYTDKEARSGGIEICGECGHHARQGGVSRYSLRGDGAYSFTCRNCDQLQRAAK